MKKQIEEMYEKQKNRRVKAIVTGLFVYAITMGIVSAFLGNPFPHKETLLILETTRPGWIYTDGYLLCFCSTAGGFAGIGNIVCGILNQFRKLDPVLLQECDAKRYLELMEYAVTYGKGLKWRGLQKTVLLLAEQRYVAALITNQKFEEARGYLNEGWIGKRSSRLFRQTAINLELAQKYADEDVESFCKVFQSAGKEFTKNQLFGAKEFMLRRDYEAAVELLTDREGKTPYSEVGRKFLLGKCYDELGDQSQAIACMEYVAEHGNTMPHKAWAQEWLSRKPLFLLEQKEDFNGKKEQNDD